MSSHCTALLHQALTFEGVVLELKQKGQPNQCVTKLNRVTKPAAGEHRRLANGHQCDMHRLDEWLADVRYKTAGCAVTRRH